jgi:uncharacterized protein (DUF488 family)
MAGMVEMNGEDAGWVGGSSGAMLGKDFAMSMVYTVGHSSHPFEAFLKLLGDHGVAVLVDVRSAPYSKYAPQFDREVLQRALNAAGIKYLFLGAELGGRPENQAYYDAEGHAVYSRMTTDPAFVAGIERLERGMANYRLALMCGEEDPAHCHRRLLVARILMERGHEVLHIRGDGRVVSDEDVASQSGKSLVNEQPALFAELDEDQWRSTASVLPKRAQASSSRH